MPRFDSYIICTSPRSGSTLLCNLLAATGAAGKPESYFHRADLSAWLSSLDISPRPGVPEPEILAEIFRAVIERGSAGTGLFGLRLQRDSFGYFAEKLAVLHPGHATDLQRFEAAFGRTLFIHLTRLDKVEQAISNVMAEQTGLWHRAPDGTELERQGAPAEPDYDAVRIREVHDMALERERAWQCWFEGEDIRPLRITYEDLSGDPAGTLRTVLSRLGVPVSAADGVVPGVAKLADETSRDWARRFRTEQSAS